MPVITDRITELKTALDAKIKENDEIAAAFKIEDNGGVVVSTEQAARFRQNVKEGQEIKALIEQELEAKELAEFGEKVNGFLSEPESSPIATRVAAESNGSGGGHYRPQVEAKSIGQLFTESEAFKNFRSEGGYTMREDYQYKGDLATGYGLETKDVYTTMVAPTTTLGFGTLQRDPLVPRPMRTQRVRDLFPVTTTTANLIDYFRVTGFTNNASPVPERSGGNFGIKPHSTLTFAPAQAPVRTIAHWEAAHRNVLSDEPQLQAIINNELMYGLRLTEDDQILNGTGTSEDLLGVLNTSGIQLYGIGDGPGTDNKADAIRRSATKVMLAYYEATGVVVHPYDWEDIELAKDANERYLFMMNVAVGMQQTLWRMRVVDSPAMAEGTALVGAFGLGAQLYDREQANIRIAEQHADFFVRNAVVVLAEQRLALAVKRPEAFVKVDLTP